MSKTPNTVSLLELLDDEAIRNIASCATFSIEESFGYQTAICMAVHCCLNGPVSIHAESTFWWRDGYHTAKISDISVE